jgi:hypothetical protein
MTAPEPAEPAPAEVPQYLPSGPTSDGGYVPAWQMYRIEPTDPDLAGMWMRVRGCALGQLLDWGFGPALHGDPAAVFRAFASCLDEWNVRDPITGTPVEPTYAGLLSLDEQFARRLMRLWRNAITGVPASFDNASSGGPPAPPMPLPMTPADPATAAS